MMKNRRSKTRARIRHSCRFLSEWTSSSAFDSWKDRLPLCIDIGRTIVTVWLNLFVSCGNCKVFPIIQTPSRVHAYSIFWNSISCCKTFFPTEKKLKLNYTHLLFFRLLVQIPDFCRVTQYKTQLHEEQSFGPQGNRAGRYFTEM